MMRTMRENTKWVFYILAVSFVGWLVFDVGMGVTGGNYGGADVVLRIDGESIHLPQYQAALQAAMEQARQRTGGNLKREDEKQVEDQMVEQLIRNVLLEHETRRLGITVTDQEVRDAAQSSPPPEVYSVPDFQTNGQFDPNKWRRFLQGGANRELLVQLEQRYREQIPQAKLLQYITADLYTSDAKLWRVYRDQHDSVTIALLSIGPEQIADSEVSLSDAELERFFDAHRSEFTRPATAWLSFVAVPRRPFATDSAATLERAVRLRAEATTSQAKFEEVARRESADTASGSQGGDLGWIKRNEPGFDLQFLEGLRGLSVGQVSRPTRSSFGFHLIRIDAAKGDSVRVRHILVETEAEARFVLARLNRGERFQDLAKTLSKDPGSREQSGDLGFIGRGQLVPEFERVAFTLQPGQVSDVVKTQFGFHIIQMIERKTAQPSRLEQVREQIRRQLLSKKQEGDFTAWLKLVKAQATIKRGDTPTK